MKQTAKWHRNHEKKKMKEMSLTPVPLSGAGLQKEDGANDDIIAQLKTTTKASYTLKIDDIHTLFKNAIITHKIPIFMIDFCEHDITLCCFQKKDIENEKNMTALLAFLKNPHEIQRQEIGNETLADLF
jgi:hypothetical protein